MGSNGAYYNYSGVQIPDQPPGSDIIASSQGGGCVTKGPFANLTVHLGPVANVLEDVPKNPRPDGFGYNPRCLRRDVNQHSSAVSSANFIYDLITGSPDITWFQGVLQGQHPQGRFAEGKWGLHAAGHYTTGGDPGGVSDFLLLSSFLVPLSSCYDPP